MPKKHAPLPYGTHPSAYGGILRRRSKGRGKRTLSLRYCMHLVLRSSVARGSWSFVRGANRTMINGILAKHARASGLEILGTGNAGNHLHLRVKFSNKTQYFHFIRAVAGEIALKIKKIPNPQAVFSRSFWDQRPFSSIVSGNRYVTRLKEYIKINELEGRGHTRAFARLVVQKWREQNWKSDLSAAANASRAVKTFDG
jgi:REP element-mobilizing transposase RayT